MMDCPPGVYTCVEVQQNVDNALVEQMPVCIGDWRELPEPLPSGQYGVVFTAKVTDPAVTMQIMRGGRVVAVVRNGETRNWECRETAHPERIS